MRTIVIANQKGGTGKTSSALSLLQAAAADGLRCLAVDLDPQGQLSSFLQANTTDEAGVY